MILRILESNLNLRVDRRYNKKNSNTNYILKKEVAEAQLAYKDIDLYCNVEYMECENQKYLDQFEKEYHCIKALFGKDKRGILCYVRKEFIIHKIKEFDEPHFLHFKITKDNETVDVIVFRILVAKTSIKDFKDRAKQWNKVMDYLNSLNTSNLIMTGDWNHGKVRDTYTQEHCQYHFSYQQIKSDLEGKNMTMGINLEEGHKENSYNSFLAIDHIAIGSSLSYKENPQYSSKYKVGAPIGTSDHAYLFASIETK